MPAQRDATTYVPRVLYGATVKGHHVAAPTRQGAQWLVGFCRQEDCAAIAGPRGEDAKPRTIASGLEQALPGEVASRESWSLYSMLVNDLTT